jgi:hypothetical protein
MTAKSMLRYYVTILYYDIILQYYLIDRHGDLLKKNNFRKIFLPRYRVHRAFRSRRIRVTLSDSDPDFLSSKKNKKAS